MREDTYINLGKFLHTFNELELFINLIITHHIQPKDEQFFLDYILNTSVINFGAKIKILINLNILSKVQISKISEFSRNRNVFAHSNRDTDFVDSVVENPITKTIEIKITDVIFKTNTEGKLIKMFYNDFIKGHIILQNEIIDFIIDYVRLNKIYTHNNHIQNLQLYKL